MGSIQDQLDKLAVSIFSANVEAASSVAHAAQHLRHIYCALSDLVTLCEDFERWRDNRALGDASGQLEGLQRSADSLEQTYGTEQPLELSEIYRRISWRMVQLMSHKLRSCVASLRLKYAILFQPKIHLDHKPRVANLYVTPGIQSARLEPSRETPN
jgi:hypothetical protein